MFGKISVRRTREEKIITKANSKFINMAKQMKMFDSAILATSAMTAFSYLFSYLSKNNTREPELLGKMMRRLFPGMSKPTARAGGWTAHYAVGLL
jgi:hypothetical protein